MCCMSSNVLFGSFREGNLGSVGQCYFCSMRWRLNTAPFTRRVGFRGEVVGFAFMTSSALVVECFAFCWTSVVKSNRLICHFHDYSPVVHRAQQACYFFASARTMCGRQVCIAVWVCLGFAVRSGSLIRVGRRCYILIACRYAPGAKSRLGMEGYPASRRDALLFFDVSNQPRMVSSGAGVHTVWPRAS